MSHINRHFVYSRDNGRKIIDLLQIVCYFVGQIFKQWVLTPREPFDLFVWPGPEADIVSVWCSLH